MSYDALIGRKAWLEEQIDNVKTRLAAAPEGRLQQCSRKDHLRYYQSFPHSDKRVYLNADQKDLIEALMQKRYDEQVLKILEREKTDIERLLDRNAPAKIDKLYLNLPEAHRAAVNPVRFPTEIFCEQWAMEGFETKGIYGDTGFVTEKGEKVRSKSEVIIANTLHAAKIPYRYECPLYLEGYGPIHPDFTVLNPRTHGMFYWEHLGMMDMPEYRTKARIRLRAYENNGYLLGKELIVTSETSEEPLDTRCIRRRIDAFLR